MLRLAKAKKSQEIVISLREREGFLTKALLQAFALALFIHMSGFLLFQVQPFKLTSSYIFAPVNVEIPVIDGHLELSKELIKEDLAFLELPSIIFETPKEALVIDDLSILPMLTQVDYHSTLQIPYEYKPIQIMISGQLAQRPLKEQMDEGVAVAASPEKVSAEMMQYQVQVDPYTGEIIWYKKTKGSEEFLELSEGLLSKLRFETDHTFEHIVGEVTFILQKEKNDV